MTRQTLYDALRYGSGSPPTDEKEKDPAFEALLPVLQGRLPALWAADTEREISRALVLAEEFGLRVWLTGAREAYRSIPVLKEKKIPVILNANISAEPRRANEEGATDPLPQAVLEERYRLWAERGQNAKVLNEQAVPFALGSEGDTSSDFIRNVRRLIALGLKREAALAALTKDAASLLGVGDKLGTLEKGKLANVTVMDGDFVEEKTAVKMVFVLGKKTEVK